MHKPHCCYTRPQFMNFRMIHTHTQLCVWQTEEDPFWIFHNPSALRLLLHSCPPLIPFQMKLQQSTYFQSTSLTIYLLFQSLQLPHTKNLSNHPRIPITLQKVTSGHLYYLFRDQKNILLRRAYSVRIIKFIRIQIFSFKSKIRLRQIKQLV